MAISLLGCDRSAPAATSAEAFEPTAFTVTVTGHGKPIIFIPGLGCPGSVWDDTVAHLDGYEAHVVTLAGFAGVPRIDGPLAAEAREQLARYIREHHLVQPVVVGHSMGGFLAYWLAETEPSLVGKTIVVESGAALGDGDRAANIQTGSQVREMWSAASDEQFAQQVHDIFGSMAAHRDRLAPYLDAIARSDRTAIGDAIYEQFTTDLRPQLAKIKSPLLLVLADGSLAAGMKKQAESVPNHTVVVVPNAKHFVMLDEPEAFDAALDSFL
jgi:pimeloyl-ACP methyl ester carboxylesterase